MELQFSDPTVKAFQSEALIAAYAGATAVTVALMFNSMVLCSFMLSNILRNGKSYVSEDEEAEFLYACRKFALSYAPGDTPPQPQRSFERYWETRCEADWRNAFRMFTCGVPVFMVNIACMAWLKFNYSYAAAGTATAVAVCATAGWARTQMNWGWHISRRYHGRGNHPGVRGGGGGRDGGCGLPFDWHARPDAVVKQPSGAGGGGGGGGGAADAAVERERARRTEQPVRRRRAARVPVSTPKTTPTTTMTSRPRRRSSSSGRWGSMISPRGESRARRIEPRRRRRRRPASAPALACPRRFALARSGATRARAWTARRGRARR